MDTNWIEDFLCLADTRSFSRAAGKRHSSQPAFSRRIQSLEAWLGVELVDRAASPLCLTAAGSTFQGMAVGIVQQIHLARATLGRDAAFAGAAAPAPSGRFSAKAAFSREFVAAPERNATFPSTISQHS